jgi:hypothetical protein
LGGADNSGLISRLHAQPKWAADKPLRARAQGESAARKKRNLMNLRASLRVSLCCLAPLVFTDRAWPQEQRIPPRAPAADIIQDNLNRAAATAEQLLEVLNKEPGLMVEFKQLLAKDAGVNGQILEETDLKRGSHSRTSTLRTAQSHSGDCIAAPVRVSPSADQP